MNWNLVNKLRCLTRVGLVRTIYLNFACLPFKQAVKFPIVVPRGTFFYDLSGKIEIKSKVRFAQISFGFVGDTVKAWKNDRICLNIGGTLSFEGCARFGNGVSIKVANGATLSFGDDVIIGSDVKIISNEQILIGKSSRIAWESQIIDTSFHFIENVENKSIYPLNKPIIIGANVWVGNRTAIMKGAEIPAFCIVAAGSLINKKIVVPPYSMIAGTPAKLVKQGVRRLTFKEEKKIRKQLAKGNAL